MRFIGEYWRGEKPLWKAFWLCGFLMQAVINNILVVLMFMLVGFIGGLLQFSELSVTTVAIFTMLIYFFLYFIWNGVSIWRCAQNSEFIWQLLAKIYAAFYIFPIISFAILLFVASFNIGAIINFLQTQVSSFEEQVDSADKGNYTFHEEATFKYDEKTKKLIRVDENQQIKTKPQEIDINKIKTDKEGFVIIPNSYMKE